MTKTSRLKVLPISLREANDFVEAYHRHSKRTTRDGGRFAIGVSDGIQLWGVAIVGRPVARLLQDGETSEVSRCCVSPGAPKGACSFLYARCWRIWQAMGGQRMITYTLTTESGASLRGAGYKLIGKTRGRKQGQAWTAQGRERDWQAIYGQNKFRWEMTAP